MMFVTLAFLILFIISYIVDFRQYKNVFLLGLFIISLMSTILIEIIVPALGLNLNINYIIIANIIYCLIVIVVMLLALLNTRKRIANEGKIVTNMIVIGYGSFILINFLIIIFKPYLLVELWNGLILIAISTLFYYLNLIFILHNLYAWIVSGGQGSDEAISEAEAMRRYLVEQGIRNEEIIMEDKSTNTEENLVFSMKKMDTYKKHALATIVSNHFHILRAAFLSKKVKMNASVTGGSSKSYFYPNAYIREYLAIIYMFKKTHALIIIILLLAVTSYTLWGI
ncbi:YdcF family protein [Mammaliicoccus sciuri]|nr:YdcF family protein [Mammaliicoccus sciuri]